MRPMARAFWNGEEQRIRALCRLLLFAMMFLLALFLIALAGLALPQTPLVEWAGGVAVGGAAVLTVWIACRALDQRHLVDLGFSLDRAWWGDLLFGLALGALLMSGVFGVAAAAGWIEVHSAPAASAFDCPLAIAVLLSLLQCTMTGIWEEAVFRGYLLRNQAEGLSGRRLAPRDALLLSAGLTALAFAAAHCGSETPGLALANLFLAGGFFAAAVAYTGQLALPIGFHIAWNFFQGGVFGFSVSGQPLTASLVSVDDRGPAVWTGGEYGPEGGLLGSAAFAAAIALTLAWLRVRRGELTIREQLAVYRPTSVAAAGGG